MLGFPPFATTVLARETSEKMSGQLPVLSGTQFDLVIGETVVNFTGTPRMATTVNGSLPALHCLGFSPREPQKSKHPRAK